MNLEQQVKEAALKRAKLIFGNENCSAPLYRAATLMAEWAVRSQYDLEKPEEGNSAKPQIIQSKKYIGRCPNCQADIDLDLPGNITPRYCTKCGRAMDYTEVSK